MSSFALANFADSSISSTAIGGKIKEYKLKQSALTEPDVSGGCFDSDGGLNYYVQGTKTLSNANSYTDYCLDSAKLQEYRCLGNDVKFDCTSAGMICDIGVCIEQNSKTPKTKNPKLPVVMNNTNVTVPINVTYGNATIVNATNVTTPGNVTINQTHTHLSDYRFAVKSMAVVLLNPYNQIYGSIDCSEFGQGYVVLGGGYSLNNVPTSGNWYAATDDLSDPITYQVLINDISKQIGGGVMHATCAKVEPTLHQFGQDY